MQRSKVFLHIIPKNEVYEDNPQDIDNEVANANEKGIASIQENDDADEHDAYEAIEANLGIENEVQDEKIHDQNYDPIQVMGNADQVGEVNAFFAINDLQDEDQEIEKEASTIDRIDEAATMDFAIDDIDMVEKTYDQSMVSN